MASFWGLVGSTCSFLLITTDGLAQSRDSLLQGKISSGILFSDGNYTPFWVRANQFGVVPRSGTYSTTAVEFHSNYKEEKPVEVSYGASVWLNASEENTEILIQEAYVASKWRAWEVFAGRKKQVFGVTDSLISSGSYSWSGNALPLTKVEVGTKGFYYPKILGGNIAVNMSYGHGFFSNDRIDVHDFYLHQKQLYVKLGSILSPIKLVIGGNHQVQWGGTLQFQDTINNSGVNGKVAADFKSYLRAVMASSAGDEVLYGINDGGNRYGNHLGSLDLGLEIESEFLKVFAYRQSFYEDGSLFRLENIADGLHGLSFQFKKGKVLKRWVFEYFNSKDQGGVSDQNFRGDNYFNNEVYRQGWSNHQTSIGTPFITFLGETDFRNSPGIMPYFNNNRVTAYYSALFFKVQNWEFTLKGSIAYAYWAYDNPFPVPKKLMAIGLSVNAPLNLFGVQSILSSKLGYDSAGWFNSPNFGGIISLSLPIF
ncbi:MAG: hypothetical protein RLZZ241_441 [Bacteroidota bacterium]